MLGDITYTRLLKNPRENKDICKWVDPLVFSDKNGKP